MKALLRLIFTSTLLLNSLFTIALANPQLANVQGARANMEILTAQSFQSKAFPYPHEVTVALPASYTAQAAKEFPVLWVLDSPMMFRTVVGVLDLLVIGNQAPEMIVVGVGSRSEDGLAAIGRRIMEFSPKGKNYAPQGIPGERFFALAPIENYPQMADEFLNMLVKELRPTIQDKYRTSGRHALFGHSAGGLFAAYTLFTHPDSFSDYIIGSPYLEGVDGAVFQAEKLYAQKHQDLQARVFIGVGDQEHIEYFLSMSGIVESSARLSRLLKARHYPSLDLSMQFFPGKNHYTSVPDILIYGIQHAWQEEIANLPSSWPSKPNTNATVPK